MLPRWSRTIIHLSRAGLHKSTGTPKDIYVAYRNHSRVAAATTVTSTDSTVKDSSSKQPVNINKMFWSKACSLALAPDSPLYVEELKYEGFKHIMLKLLLFYSKQSKSIRGANVVYRRIISQVDKPAIYDVFNLEKTFKTTFSLLVLHMWLCLRRLKEEGKEGVEFGQYLYEIYNHDLELRVSKAGVNLLLTRWMKDLEKIFYGNVVAYDAAMLPEARPGEFQNVIWRNVFSDDGSPMPNDAASHAVQAMSRYARRESACLSLTDTGSCLNLLIREIGG
ncbi:PREDICTED: ubiquinol-cytochrome-c reductase complex assembly factor 1 isoform X2 [Nelumbo nucifera]|uniref:Ubiquinol-cytochrome-c reductase complex assembly factor 1 isoform X2 n=1 Tax=Nelumbo nucifera TaxID=4432 RepID=A0A1U8A9T9_NELNU|nr:PREDICTED: ubiquinol-cytochrome-c reductase complex assembly factor 1 isoform X2 [Nelumbo nucifera]